MEHSKYIDMYDNVDKEIIVELIRADAMIKVAEINAESKKADADKEIKVAEILAESKKTDADKEIKVAEILAESKKTDANVEVKDVLGNLLLHVLKDLGKKI